MGTVHTRQFGAAGPAPEDVRAHLELVLNSTAFRGSKRCQQFLRHIVEETLAGRGGDLKERTIGVDVFGRESSYQTSEDAIVRVKANEVRKRLAQYYQEIGPERVRIELSSGSYVPEFYVVDGPVAVAERPAAPVQTKRRAWAWAVGVLVLVLLLGGGYWRWRGPATPLDRFWQPVLDSPRPVMICLPQPPAFQLSRELQDQILRKNPEQQTGDEVHPLVTPGVQIRSEQLVPITDLYVAEGDAMAALRFMRMLTRKEKPVDVRIGNDITFPEMRDAASILIGAFSNRWTLQMTRDLRFVFERELNENGRVFQIRDKRTGKKWALVNVYPSGKSPVDYGLISRVFDSTTGKTLVTVAGLTMTGTQAAAELLTEPELFAAAMKSSPVNWEKRNLQILLETKVVGKNPGRPQVIATHVW